MSKSTWVVDNLVIDLQRKRMKNLRLAVLPPKGKIRLSAPVYACEKELLAFVQQNKHWIAAEQTRLQQSYAKKQAKWQDGVVVELCGRKLRLDICHNNRIKCSRIFCRQDEQGGERLCLELAHNESETEPLISSLIDKWCRQELKILIPQLIEKWQPIVGVKVNDWGIRKMRTRWGTCNIGQARIWLSLELAKYPMECLEYVVVHEMVHLLERNHTPRFWQLVESFFPQWKQAEALLK